MQRGKIEVNSYRIKKYNLKYTNKERLIILKTHKKFLILISILLIIFMLFACGEDAEEPEIKIYHGSYELDVIYYGNWNNEKQEEIEEGLQGYMVGKKFSELPTVDYGSKIQIEAENFETEKMEIYNFVLNDNAKVISDFDDSFLAESSIESGMAEFTFVNNHDLNQYQAYAAEGKLIHGLLIRCEIAGDDFVFTTLVLGE